VDAAMKLLEQRGEDNAPKHSVSAR
jgi:hypothetical protein